MRNAFLTRQGSKSTRASNRSRMYSAGLSNIMCKSWMSYYSHSGFELAFDKYIQYVDYRSDLYHDEARIAHHMLVCLL